MHPLATYLRDHSRPMEPQVTGVSPHLPILEGILCAVFDIYGTLLISGSGDIGVTDAAQQEDTLRKLITGMKLPVPDPGHSLSGQFLELIRQDHAKSKTGGIEFPEVEIREIWARLVSGLPGEPPPAPDQVEALAVAYENATNPVWPMPGAGDLLRILRDRGITLGIVSNAQFYTPLLFEAFFDAPLDQLGFDPDLLFFSYRHRQGKPGAWLYEQLRDALAARGIAPGETLYVGNDALKDVHPAAALGFRTALFAGDHRSLRLRPEHPNLLPPETTVTSLLQILDLLPPKSDKNPLFSGPIG